MHVTLLQQTFSPSLGIGTQTLHLHHSGVSLLVVLGHLGLHQLTFCEVKACSSHT